MASIKSLPSRPLTADEVFALDDSGKFVGISPINVVFEPEHDQAFVISLVLLTERHVVAAQYGLQDRSWTKLYQGAAETDEERDEAYADAEVILEEFAEDLEVGGAISEVVDESVEDGVNQTMRDAGDLGKILAEHYEDALSDK